MKTIAFSILSAGAVLLFVFFGVLYFIQERLIFVPERLPDSYRFDFKRPFEERVLESAGLKIDSLYFHAPQARAIILYFHGNAGSLSSWGDVAETLSIHTSSDVWIMDYPGYGKSTGQITSQDQLLEIAGDFARRAQAEAKRTGRKLVIFGRSIGSALAVRVAAQTSADALILETPYESVSRLAGEAMPFAPGFLLRYPLPLATWLEEVRCPILILHGDQDTTIPVHHSQNLAAHKKPAPRLMIFPGAHHNDLGEQPAYWPTVEEFLKGI